MTANGQPEKSGQCAGTCEWRRETSGSDQDSHATCRFVATFLGISGNAFCDVSESVCRECLQSLRHPPEINSVCASLIYRVSGEIIEAGGAVGCAVEKAEGVRTHIRHQLGYVPAGTPHRLFPPTVKAGDRVRAGDSASVSSHTSSLKWMVGMLTAPRAEPTISQSLTSFSRAGFDCIHLYAEPDAAIPDHSALASVSRNQSKLGNLANFLMALADLLERGRDANCFAMLQDDVIAAENLKGWCEEQLWPMSCGLVSLFTPRIHRAATIGWKQLFPGFFRVHGGQALVFRRDVLGRFLSDPHVLAQMQARRHGDDALVSGWATIRGVGIAYHTPSPTQHIGSQSSIYETGPDPLNTAEFVSETRHFHKWQPPKARRRRIGLIGWNCDTGLGTLNRDLSRHLKVDRWIVMPCPYAPTREAPRGQKCEFVSGSCTRDELRRRLKGLDWLLFAERPLLPNMTEIAREAGLRIACIPMWEWLSPAAGWIAYVDLMICPTHHTYVQLEDWKKRFGFSYDLIEVPWPLSLDNFQFRCRKRLKRVLYVNGFGGCEGLRPDGTRVNYRRKGADIVFEAASQLPQLGFDLFSMARLPPSLPRNITLHPAPSNIADLYRVGDVCVQPSAWEGIGLPLLECQASGLPLITTDAPPMNEYRPFRTLEVDYHEAVMLADQPFLSRRPSAASLVKVLQELHGCDLTDASRSARRFIETEHSWGSAELTLERCFAADNLACVTAD